VGKLVPSVWALKIGTDAEATSLIPGLITATGLPEPVLVDPDLSTCPAPSLTVRACPK
jgi:hypothetical protein